MSKQSKPISIQTALIGLLGTVLTVCGGLCGALVTSAVAIYQVEREAQMLDVPSSGGEQVLSINTGNIFLSRKAAADLDAELYYIDLEDGFVLRRPLDGWSPMDELTLEEQLAETNITCLVLCDQPVYRIRYGQPIEVESDRNTTVNGHLVPDDLLDLNEQFYGPPPWKVPYYSQLILNIYPKDIEQTLGVDNLAELIVVMTQYASGSTNKMVAHEGTDFAILQGSNALAGIRLEGVPGTMVLEDWSLFAVSEYAYYSVEILFTVQSGQPLHIWDDLQTYINEFRIIE